MTDPAIALIRDHTILSVIIGSRAYGLDTEDSDIDRRGVFAAPAAWFWRLDKPPTHVEGPEEERFSWEVERFCKLALAANPTVLECLWSPLVETETSAGRDLREMRSAFLSREVLRTFSKYADTQLRRADRATPNWKQVMHMLRLLISGRNLALTGEPMVIVTEFRDRLLAVRRGEVSWPEVDAWRSQLIDDLEHAAERCPLPESPARHRVEEYLIDLRKGSINAA